MGYLDASHLFKPNDQPTCTVDGFLVKLVWENGELDEALETPERVVVHWTAGSYHMAFNAYHFNIVWDAVNKRIHVIKTLNLSQLGQHTYHLNHHSVGVSFACMGDGAPWEPEMVAQGAEFIAELMAWLHLDPSKVSATAEAHLIDHATVGQFLDEGGKVDVRPFWGALVQKTQAHHALVEAGHAPFQYAELFKDAA